MDLLKNIEIIEKTIAKLLNNSFISKLPAPLSCQKMIAFTLAEVLITLLIIGVVASLVIPALIQDTQDAELKTAWKKTYSDLDQATRKIMLDNAGTLKNISLDDFDDIKRNYKPFLNYTKICNQDGSIGNCWHSQFSYLNGNDATDHPLESGIPSYSRGTGFILSNGALVYMNQDGPMLLCSSTRWTRTGGINHVCGAILVDVNGFKKPNVVGKDIYGMWLFENSMKPIGIQNDGWSNECTPQTSGWGCSAQYLYQ